VKDVDICAKQIIVRNGKGAKDRVTVLPQSVLDYRISGVEIVS
jgi:hypothetical protein